MIDQKRENLLNLALAATEVERRRVPELSAGYNSYSKTWEVIVQYQGVPDGLRDRTAADYLSGETEITLFRRCICAEHILYYACAGGGYGSVWEWGAACMH